MPKLTRPLSRAALEPTEHEIQSAFFARVDMDPRTRELPIYAVPNFSGHVGGAVARLRAGKRSKDEGRRKGVPDVNVDVPRNGYPGLRLEFKRGKAGRLSPEQVAWHEKLRGQGYVVDVVRSAEEAWRVLASYLQLRA